MATKNICKQIQFEFCKASSEILSLTLQIQKEIHSKTIDDLSSLRSQKTLLEVAWRVLAVTFLAKPAPHQSCFGVVKKNMTDEFLLEGNPETQYL